MTAVPPVLKELAALLAEPGGGARVGRGRPGRGGRQAAVLIRFSGPAGAAAPVECGEAGGDGGLEVVERGERHLGGAGLVNRRSS